jgi:hypothetical protein
MKKVLLSLSMLAATVFAANAQGTLIPVYGGGIGNISDSVNSEEGFASFLPPVGGSVPASFTNQEETTAGNTYLRLTGSSDAYYVWGASNGNFKADGTGLNSFGYNGTAAGFVAFKAKAASDKPLSKLKIGFVPANDETKTFSAEIHEIDAFEIDPEWELEPGTWKSFNIPFSSFFLENADGDKLDANGVITEDPTKFVTPTLAQIKAFGQINVILNTQSCNYSATLGDCDPIVTDSDVSVDDIYLTQTALTTIPPIATSTKSAAANIASTKVFPNPATGAFTAEVALKNNASVTVIVTDMMGKQIATKSVNANGQANFETAGLANGLYTVTYVVDGTPAKTELVVVK